MGQVHGETNLRYLMHRILLFVANYQRLSLLRDLWSGTARRMDLDLPRPAKYLTAEGGFATSVDVAFKTIGFLLIEGPI